MKLFTKISLIVCAALISLGALCLGCGIALGSGIGDVIDMADRGQFNIGGLHLGGWGVYFGPDDEEGTADVQKGIVQESFFADEVNSLDIDIKYGKVFLEDGAADQISVTVDAPGRNQYRLWREDGVLSLKDETKYRFWKSGRNEEARVTIRMPEGKWFDELKLETNAGMVDISNAITAGKIEFQTEAGELTAADVSAEDELKINLGAGKVFVERFLAKSLDAKCGMGEMILDGDVLRKAKAECGMGSVEISLRGRESDFDYEVECGMGEISLNGDSSSGFGAASKKIDNNAEKKLELSCGMGMILVETEE